jgi:hypothetical protein
MQILTPMKGKIIGVRTGPLPYTVSPSSLSALFLDDEADTLSGGPTLLSKVNTLVSVNPYGGAPVTGLTNLLDEV